MPHIQLTDGNPFTKTAVIMCETIYQEYVAVIDFSVLKLRKEMIENFITDGRRKGQTLLKMK